MANKLLSTRTMSNDFAKHKNNGRKRVLSTRTMQMRLPSTRTMPNEVGKHKNDANEVAKEKNDGKLGC